MCAYSNQDWDKTMLNYFTGTMHSYNKGDDVRYISACRCQQCGFISFWLEEQLIWSLKLI